MATSGKLTAAVFVAICVAIVTSYPRGAPESACASLIPDSHGPSTATGPSPFSLTVSSTTYSPDQVITVELGGAAFKGFLIVGRVAGSNDSVGSFQNLNIHSRLACTARPGSSGITQNNNTVKHSSSFSWKAPSASVGPVTFHYTVVRGGAPNTKLDSSDYFLGLVSAPISPAGVFGTKVHSLKKILKAHHKRVHFQGDPFEEILQRAKPFSTY